MTTDDLVNYYKALLILQYASLANALGTVDAHVRELAQNQVISQFRDAFDLNTALGAQLDILGTYRGVSRILFGVVAADDWSLIPSLDSSPNSYFGWALAAGADPTWRWLQINDLDSVPYKLTDAQMRLLISFKAAIQSWSGGLGDLDNMLYAYFGANVKLIDNENMTLTYQHLIGDPDPNNLFRMAELAGAIPHPAGVAFTITEI